MSESIETEVADARWSGSRRPFSFYAGQAVVNVAAEAVVSVDAGVDDQTVAHAAGLVTVERMALPWPQPEKLETLVTFLFVMSRHLV